VPDRVRREPPAPLDVPDRRRRRHGDELLELAIDEHELPGLDRAERGARGRRDRRQRDRRIGRRLRRGERRRVVRERLRLDAGGTKARQIPRTGPPNASAASEATRRER
jgi:hypothetical protein